MNHKIIIDGKSYEAGIGLPREGIDWGVIDIYYVEKSSYVKKAVKDNIQKSGYKFVNEIDMGGNYPNYVTLTFRLEMKGNPKAFEVACRNALHTLGITDAEIDQGIIEEKRDLERMSNPRATIAPTLT